MSKCVSKLQSDRRRYQDFNRFDYLFKRSQFSIGGMPSAERMPAKLYLKTLENWEAPEEWLLDAMQRTPITHKDLPDRGKYATQFGYRLTNGVFSRYYVGPREIVPVEHNDQLFLIRGNGNNHI